MTKGSFSAGFEFIARLRCAAASKMARNARKTKWKQPSQKLILEQIAAGNK